MYTKTCLLMLRNLQELVQIQAIIEKSSSCVRLRKRGYFTIHMTVRAPFSGDDYFSFVQGLVSSFSLSYKAWSNLMIVRKALRDIEAKRDKPR